MASYKSYNEDRTKKSCFECKKMKSLVLFRTKEKKQGIGKGKYLNNTCKDCEQEKVSLYRTSSHKGIAAEIFRRKKHECKKYNLDFDLSIDWIINRLNEIDYKCELTGLPMRGIKLNSEEKYTGFHLDSISMDRIVHDGGYTKNNIRFVLNQVNVFRSNASDDRMYTIAEALLKNRKI